MQGQLDRAKAVITRGEKLLQALPLRGKQAELSAKLETKRTEVERALEYVELYGLYTECEAVYQVDQPDGDVGAASTTPTGRRSRSTRGWSTGRRTSTRSTCPSIVQHARVKTVPGKTTTDRAGRLRKQVLDPARHVAAFDLENTLIASNVVESYSWLATRRLDRSERLRYALRTLAEAPGLLKLDRVDRGDFLRHFYRRYEDAPSAQIETDAAELLTNLILTKGFPAGWRRVREHRALGHRTILITGALDFAVEGLRPLFDEIVAAEMSVRPDGTLSGEMVQVPPTGETRAQILHDYCAAEGLRVEEAVAYADSTSDLPLLEAVGFPVAVNPETRLAAIARKRGWLVEHWSKASGGPRPAAAVRPRDGRARAPPAVRLMMTADRSARTHASVAPTATGWRSGRPQAGSGARAQRGPSMKALQVKRSVGRLGLARVASALAPAAAVRVGPLEYTEIDDPELPGPGLAAGAHPPRRHLRQRPVDDRGPRVDVLRRLGELPVRARPRGRRPARRRHARRARTGARPRGPRLRPAVRGRRAGRRRRLRPPRHRPPRARHPDRLLLLDRRRLGAVVLGPRHAAPPRSATTSPTSAPCSSSRSPAASTPP